MTRSVLVVDTYYIDALSQLHADHKFAGSTSYGDELRRVSDYGFGTGAAYVRALTALHWDASIIVPNSLGLQDLWAREQNKQRPVGLGWGYMQVLARPPIARDLLKWIPHAHKILLQQVKDIRPDVLLVLDINAIPPSLVRQLKKYVGDTKIYVAVNKDDTQISDNICIIYDDTKEYTERWKEILEQIEEETFMFMHEDMILFDKLNFQMLEKYISYINDTMLDSIKLILAGDNFEQWPIDNTLVTNQYSKFSIQPTITRKDIFKEKVNVISPLNIWQFEEAITATGRDFMVKIGGERKRGMYHYDSLVFPYVATAINKGKWNLNEYMDVLNPMFEEYNINPFERGMS